MLVARSCDRTVVPLYIHVSLALAAVHARLVYKERRSSFLSLALLLLLCTLLSPFILYHDTTVLPCCLIIQLMADIPRELDRINCILPPDDVLASGPRTPWSPIRGWTRSRPGPIAATRLIDLEDGESELPAENSGRGGATI